MNYMGINIGGIINKTKAVILNKKPPTQDEERRKLEREREEEFYHRERMVRAEDLARARVESEIRMTRRQKPAAKPAPPGQPAARGGGGGMADLLGSMGGGGMGDILGGGGGTGGGMHDMLGIGQPKKRVVKHHGKHGKRR